jgi:hypothetical protein
MTVVKNITAAALANNSDSQILLGTGTARIYKNIATVTQETVNPIVTRAAAKMTVAPAIIAAAASKIYTNISKLCDKVVSVVKGSPNITAGLGVVALVPVRIRKENNYV